MENYIKKYVHKLILHDGIREDRNNVLCIIYGTFGKILDLKNLRLYIDQDSQIVFPNTGMYLPVQHRVVFLTK